MTASIPRLILATRNAHKTRELAAMLAPAWQVCSLADFPDLPDVEETGTTFAENARLKACSISAQLDGVVLADDSGLCVDALGGAPGVYSARYAGEHGNDAANNARLLSELEKLPEGTPRTARFQCAMCLARAGEPVAEVIGAVEGQIAYRLSGSHGFGYDPLFLPEGKGCSMAELTDEQKNVISHRANALALMLPHLHAQA